MERVVLVIILTINGYIDKPALVGAYPTSADCWAGETEQLYHFVKWRHLEEKRGVSIQVLTMCRERTSDDPPVDALVRLSR